MKIRSAPYSPTDIDRHIRNCRRCQKEFENDPNANFKRNYHEIVLHFLKDMHLQSFFKIIEPNQFLVNHFDVIRKKSEQIERLLALLPRVMKNTLHLYERRKSHEEVLQSISNKLISKHLEFLKTIDDNIEFIIDQFRGTVGRKFPNMVKAWLISEINKARALLMSRCLPFNLMMLKESEEHNAYNSSLKCFLDDLSCFVLQTSKALDVHRREPKSTNMKYPLALSEFIPSFFEDDIIEKVKNKFNLNGYKNYETGTDGGYFIPFDFIFLSFAEFDLTFSRSIDAQAANLLNVNAEHAIVYPVVPEEKTTTLGPDKDYPSSSNRNQQEANMKTYNLMFMDCDFEKVFLKLIASNKALTERVNMIVHSFDKLNAEAASFDKLMRSYIKILAFYERAKGHQQGLISLILRSYCDEIENISSEMQNIIKQFQRKEGEICPDLVVTVLEHFLITHWIMIMTCVEPLTAMHVIDLINVWISHGEFIEKFRSAEISMKGISDKLNVFEIAEQKIEHFTFTEDLSEIIPNCFKKDIVHLVELAIKHSANTSTHQTNIFNPLQLIKLDQWLINLKSVLDSEVNFQTRYAQVVKDNYSLQRILEGTKKLPAILAKEKCKKSKFSEERLKQQIRNERKFNYNDNGDNDDFKWMEVYEKPLDDAIEDLLLRKTQDPEPIIKQIIRSVLIDFQTKLIYAKRLKTAVSIIELDQKWHKICDAFILDIERKISKEQQNLPVSDLKNRSCIVGSSMKENKENATVSSMVGQNSSDPSALNDLGIKESINLYETQSENLSGSETSETCLKATTATKKYFKRRRQRRRHKF